MIERVTIDQLISNLGGQLGLWMGVSYITILHLIVTCCSACCCCCKRKKQTINHEKIEPIESPVTVFPKESTM